MEITVTGGSVVVALDSERRFFVPQIHFRALFVFGDLTLRLSVTVK